MTHEEDLQRQSENSKIDKNHNDDEKKEMWFSTSAIGDVVVSLGIPGGLLYEPESKKIQGFVRKKGETMELSPETYSLWFKLLIPQELKTLRQNNQNEKISVEDKIRDLKSDKLVVILDGIVEEDYEKISGLRPIPIGMSLTNNDKDPDLIEIANGEGDSKVALTPPAFEFWSLCDYENSIDDIAKNMTSLNKLDHTGQNLVKKTILETFYLLMKFRLMFVDTK